MNCPKCDTELLAKRLLEVQADVCGGCDGIWFDRGELEAYSHHAEAQRIQPTTANRFVADAAPTKECPRCSTRTLRTGTIDERDAGACTSCRGVWLGSTQISTSAAIGSTVASALVEAAAEVLAGLLA